MTLQGALKSSSSWRTFSLLREPGMPEDPGSDFLDRLVPLLLGRDVSRDLSTPELLSRLAHSLNTVFTMLNELIGLIDSTLGG